MFTERTITPGQRKTVSPKAKARVRRSGSTQAAIRHNTAMAPNSRARSRGLEGLVLDRAAVDRAVEPQGGLAAEAMGHQRDGVLEEHGQSLLLGDGLDVGEVRLLVDR